MRCSAHNGVFDVAVFAEIGTHAAMISRAASTEAGYLSAFDKAREKIQDVAGCADKRGHKTLYVLTSSDFSQAFWFRCTVSL